MESTNNYAMGLVHARMAQHGTCVFAHTQTAGKGQRQKTWLSEPGQNIALSIIIKPKALAASQQAGLSAAVAVAVRHFFHQYAGEETKIKWPNDLYWRDRKAGGILIENILHGHQWQWAVIGIGLNINQTYFPELGGKAVSLKQITGKAFDTVNLAKELAQAVQNSVALLPAAEDEMYNQYKACMYKLNEPVHLKQGSRSFNGIIKGIAPTGELIVETTLEERFGVGEVVWVIE